MIVQNQRLTKAKSNIQLPNILESTA
ncbi:hypothetical protein PL8927_30014 [Planktothrix serta PCC 8927]|uniref:Uncharacterized protein n=1 Tax=Planktothrix serta PCC 8927 TaxID=671068 RepID=A0A7Z9DZA0_9CYAN|nr:hypothetical protein PL8927_30014 [Planktothrix serta PCC 8927]